MLLSKILEELKIEYTVVQERHFKTLGLIEYNSHDKVCTFIEDITYLNNSMNDNINVIITNKDIAALVYESNPDLAIYVVEKPRVTFFKVHNHLITKNAYDEKVKPLTLGKGCKVSPNAIIANENVTIGDNCIIEEGVIIRKNTTIGSNTIIRANSVIGGTGFEFKSDGESVFAVKHAGKVIIGNHVEIQYNNCIDKAIYPWDATIISDYTKVDNLVHIAHGVKIGEKTMIVANSSIGGRVTIGANSWIGLGATIRNGIKIGKNSRVNMGAVVTKDVDDDKAVSGNFAIEHNLFIKKLKNYSNLK